MFPVVWAALVPRRIWYSKLTQILDHPINRRLISKGMQMQLKRKQSSLIFYSIKVSSLNLTLKVL